ncbi:MAG: PaaI family thioesterase [Sphingomonadaceae bacterium]|nr:MAG: PaaI family thioesterase [Sphingomonadaceae bacterium]
MAKTYQTQRSPSSKLMGSHFVSFDAEAGEITMHYTPPAEFASPRGAVQGGLIAGFLDEVMGSALLAVTDDAYLPLNLDMKLTFLRMVPLETITAKGRVVKHGRRVAFLEGELYDQAGNQLARATSTALPTPMPGANA